MRRNRFNINRQIQRQEQEEEFQALQQEQEELQAQQEQNIQRQEAFTQDQRNNAFRNDQREIGGPPRSIRTGAFQQPNTITMPLRRNPTIPLNQPSLAFRQERSAFSNFTEQYVSDNINFTGGWDEFISQSKPNIIRLLEQKRNHKVQFSIQCKMNRKDGKFDIEATMYLTGKNIGLITPDTDLDALYDELMEELSKRIDKLEDINGSGWTFEEIEKIEIHTVEWEPLRGSKFIPLPKEILDKKAVINMQNNDDNCFMWCIARAANPVEKNPARIDKKLRIQAKALNMEGIKTPTPIKDITKFEEQNEDFSVIVLAYNENNRIYPCRDSKYTYQRKHHVILILITDEDTKEWHYGLVNDDSRLLSSQNSNYNGKIFRCWNCFNAFYKKEVFEKHKLYCSNLNPCRMIMPEEGSVVKFKNYQNINRHPFIIHVDFECIVEKIEGCDGNPGKSYTNKIQKHKPISYTYSVVSFNESVRKSSVEKYTGEDCMEEFVINIEKECHELYHIPQAISILTREDKINFNYANHCKYCGKRFLDEKDKKRDFCYYTGKYLGAVHPKCKSGKPDFIPVVFHNLSSYDSHLFITNLASKINGEKIDCIPNNEQKYISFTKHIVVGGYKDKDGITHPLKFKIRFIDSYKFMASSLSSLTNNLPQNGFKNLEREYRGEKLELTKRKGVFPYDWFDSIEKLKYKELPPIEEFYSQLSGEGISEEDYQHVKNVWNVFECNTFKDYLELYNRIDVLLLADIFENFRDICMKNYEIDPAYYFTAPGLFWDAMLKMTGIELELLSDIDMFLFFKRLVRGGISMISNRYGKANNPYMGDKFNPEEVIKYLMYYDANNLYGFIMCEKLPIDGFEWLTEDEIENLFNNQTMEVWKKTPCVVEVELEYCEKLHDLHNDLPVCPETLLTKNKVEKFVPNLRNKEKYVIHYRTLLFVLSLGLKLKKIHRGIKFREENWMKKYIDKNTYLRTIATNEFEKDFFKLGNNSVFGKGMEDILKRVDVRLVTSSKVLGKLSAKINYKGLRIFNEDLVSVHMGKTEIKMTKPIYIGGCVLDLSKIPMFDFHYNYIKQNYGNKARLLNMDTDSLTYEIETEDIYKDMSKNVNEIFDTSNYPKNHPSGIQSGINKKVPGKFKDELGGKIMVEFAGLRPKLYSFLTLEDKEEKKCKGIKTSVVKNKITFGDYKECLFNNSILLQEQYGIRSYDHQLFTEKQNKVALTPFDDKRYILEDGVNTLAWGHYKIKDKKID